MKTKNYVDGMLSFICMYEFIFHRIDISSYLKRLFYLMIFYNENQQPYSRCSIRSTLHEPLINAEFYFCILIKGLTNLNSFKVSPIVVPLYTRFTLCFYLHQKSE